MRVWVLRLGHRIHRDERLTTHVALTARAFGCDGIIFSGEKDDSVIKSIKRVVKRWGRPFEVEYEKDWRKVIKNWNGKTVHLTMYGLPIQDKIDEIRKCKENLLIVVGSEKVPGEVYHMSDWNVAVTNQPHSEVAALSVFLHELFEGKELIKKFDSSKIIVIPKERGKKVTSTSQE